MPADLFAICPSPFAGDRAKVRNIILTVTDKPDRIFSFVLIKYENVAGVEKVAREVYVV